MKRCNSGLQVLAVAAAAAATPTLAAEPAATQVSTQFSVERRYTTNALDRVEALPDWITSLRGGVSAVIPHEQGALRLSLEAEQSAHDRFAIENDSALRLALANESKVAERLSLGVEASLSLASDGDNLDLDGAILGIRTRTISGAVALKAGYALSEEWALSGELSASRAAPGRASFEAGIVEPLQLSPRRDAVGAGLRLAHTGERVTYAAAAGAELRHVGTPEDGPFDFTHWRQFARVEAAAKLAGFDLSAAVGAERLHGIGGALDEIRPSLAASAAYTFANGATVRGALGAGLDLSGNDDPLAAWVRRAEVHVSVPLGTRVVLSAGVNAFQREYMLLGYEEQGYGGFASGRFDLGHGLALTAEVGAESRRALPDGDVVAALDASLALSMALPVAR